MSIDKSKKRATFIREDIRTESIQNASLLDEAKLTEFKARQIVNKTYDKVSQMHEIEKQIIDMETQLASQ